MKSSKPQFNQAINWNSLKFLYYMDDVLDQGLYEMKVLENFPSGDKFYENYQVPRLKIDD